MTYKPIIPILLIGALAFALMLLLLAGFGFGLRVGDNIVADESPALFRVSGIVLLIVLLAVGSYLMGRSSAS